MSGSLTIPLRHWRKEGSAHAGSPKVIEACGCPTLFWRRASSRKSTSLPSSPIGKRAKSFWIRPGFNRSDLALPSDQPTPVNSVSGLAQRSRHTRYRPGTDLAGALSPTCQRRSYYGTQRLEVFSHRLGFHQAGRCPAVHHLGSKGRGHACPFYAGLARGNSRRP